MALAAMFAIARDNLEMMKVCIPILELQSDRTTIADKISACNELHRLGPRAGLAAYDLAALWWCPSRLALPRARYAESASLILLRWR